jgi:NAD(P)-dependent dehydrogenase (short-subunit alcohol dehydrogenase family)
MVYKTWERTMGKQKWTETDVPDQSGRVAIVTGANTGLGFDTARVLAQRGAEVVLAVRNVEKGKQAAERIAAVAPGAEVTVQELDLSSLASVRSAAGELAGRYPKIDLLINNAGVMYTPYQKTADGFEMQFGTNHLGHFALTGLLLPQLLAAPGSRVVTVSSMGHRIRAKIHFDDLQFERSYDRVKAYGQAKLANLMFTYDLNRRLAAADAGTVALAAHPGGAATELGRHSPLLRLVTPVVKIFAQSPAMGALPSLRAATDPTALGGQYYGPDGLAEARGYPKVVGSSAQSKDESLQRHLWSVSEELTGLTYPL